MQAKSIIHNEVREFANYANQRSIPSIVDGLKPSQRKVIACACEEKKQLKVSQLGSKAAERYDYKHGEASIIGTVVGLAQNFPGSNNIPLLKAIGQFGNRLTKVSAAPRYIYTNLADNFYDIFQKDDFEIMDYVWDEGTRLEPKQMLPSLPMVLINGSDGTGNGFKSFILQHSAKDVAKAVAQAVNGKKLDNLVPAVTGFTGTVVRDLMTGQIVYTGIYEKVNATTLLVTELPPKYDLDKYKSVLNDLIDREVIKNYDNESNEDKWLFRVDVPRNFWSMTDDEIKAKLKLIQRETQNLVVWDEKNNLRTFDNVEDIVTYWTNHRLMILAKRRDHKLATIQTDISWLETKKKFIIIWNNDNSMLVKLKKDDLRTTLKSKGGFNDDELDRLLAMRITSLTLDEVEILDAEISKLKQQKDYYDKITPKDMILTELKKI